MALRIIGFSGFRVLVLGGYIRVLRQWRLTWKLQDCVGLYGFWIKGYRFRIEGFRVPDLGLSGFIVATNGATVWLLGSYVY